MPGKPTYEDLQTRIKELEEESAKRKQAEEALKASETKFRDLITNMQEVLYTLDRNGRITFVSPSVETMSQYRDSEMIGHHFEEFIFRDDLQRIYQDFEDLLSGRGGTETEFRMVTKSSEIRWVRIRSSLLCEGAEIIRIQGILSDITERKRSEEDVRATRDMQQLIMNNIPQGIFWKDRLSTYLGCNNVFAKAVGLESAGSIVGKTDYDLPWSAEQIESYREYDRRIMENDAPEYHIIEQMRDADGKLAWVETNKVPLHDAKGTVIGILGTYEDITERKRAEHALRESEERWQFALQGAGDGVWDWNAVTDEVFFSRQWKAMLGFEDHEIGNTLEEWDKRVHPDDRERVYTDINTHFSGETPVYINEHRVRCKNGTYKWILDRGKVVSWTPDGKPLRVIGTHTDLTERKRAEEALRKSEARFRELADLLPQAVYEAGAQGILTYANRYAFELFGYSAEDFENGLSIFQMLLPEERDRAAHVFRGLLTGNTQDTGRQYRAVRKDGVSFPVMIHSSPIAHKGKVVGLRGVIVDMTAHKRAEEKNQELQAQLIQAQKMEAIGTLAGGIAHDFNNILGIILGYTEMTLTQMTQGDRYRENLNEVYRAALRARDLVKQILTFSRQAPQEKKPLRVDLVAKEALKFLRSSLPSTIEIQQKIGKNPGQVMGDFTQIHQVIMNLCVNAAHAMKEKGGVLRVEVEDVDVGAGEAARFGAPSPGPYCRLRVSDTGHGMDGSTMSRIFDPYFTTKGPEEGTGLGLAVVHGVVKSHSGGITVESEPGKGTTFEIVLPKVEVTPDIDIRIETDLPLGKGERILVVDDEPGMAVMYRGMLDSLGYRTDLRTSSIEAHWAFSAKPDDYDLVLTDMTMPHMTGLDLAKRILEIRPHMPIVLSTGFSEHVEAKARAQGIRCLVMKPVTRKQMAEALEKVLRSSGEKE